MTGTDMHYRDLLSTSRLTRPEGLAKVEVRVTSAEYEPEGHEFTRQFQELLDRECSKASFFNDCGDRGGCRVIETGAFIAGKAEVWLFSTKREPVSDDWVKVLAVGRPFAGGNFF
jgi:hypothetical protein